MSRDAPEPRSFGASPAAALRGAVLLALLGCGAVYGVVRMLTRPYTPLGELMARSGPLPQLLLGLGMAAVLALAVTGYSRSLRTASRFRLSEEGLDVEGPFGAYRLAWDNVAGFAVAGADGLGIKVTNRERVLETHQGTEQQREWLRSMAPFGEWDFLYLRAEMGHPGQEVTGWMSDYRPG